MTVTAPTTPNSASPSSQPARADNRRAFILTVIILAVAAAGLNTSVGYLQLHFRKEPVPMRVDRFANMPEVIGTWVQAARDENLEPDTLAALGTEQYLFCNYIDAAKLKTTPQALLARFKGKTLQQQRKEIDQLRRAGQHDALLGIALTYYTGKADTVAHIPERCYVGGGFDPVNPKSETWNLPDLARQLPVRMISFESTNARGYYSNVAYFFQANGRYQSDPLAVRRVLQNLFNRYGYYAKVELMCGAPATDEWSNRSRDSMRSFLDVALPEIEKALPDWSRYQGRR